MRPETPGGRRAPATLGDIAGHDDNEVVHMEIGRDQRANATVIRLVGELDLATAPDVLAAVEAEVGNGKRVHLVLDMSGVSFIDSTGVRTLLEAARAADSSLSLLAPSPAVTRVLELTELRGHLPEIPDLDAVGG